jgi:hypothetical protein
MKRSLTQRHDSFMRYEIACLFIAAIFFIGLAAMVIYEVPLWRP